MFTYRFSVCVNKPFISPKGQNPLFINSIITSMTLIKKLFYFSFVDEYDPTIGKFLLGHSTLFYHYFFIFLMVGLVGLMVIHFICNST